MYFKKSIGSAFIVSLVIISFCASCEKGKKVIYDSIAPELLDNYNFKPGSYWIYRDSATGIEDSLIATDYHTDTVENGSSLREVHYAPRIWLDITRYNLSNPLDRSRWYESMQESLFQFYGPEGGMSIYTNEINFQLVNINVLGTVYENVKCYRYLYNTMYLKDHVGPVHFSNGDKAKDLVRYHVVF
jgi:hypothetical protein